MKRRMPSYAVERPQRSPNVGADVAVPLLQAFVTAVVLGTGIVTVLWGVWDMEYWPTWPITTAGLFVFAWIWRLRAVSETLWITETALGIDIDQNGVVGKPDHDHIIVSGPTASQVTPAERKRARFVMFLRAIGATGDTSRERFERTLGRAMYEEFRDALLSRPDLARWVDEDNHRRGWELVADADEIVRGVM